MRGLGHPFGDHRDPCRKWVPAFAGMTGGGSWSEAPGTGSMMRRSKSSPERGGGPAKLVDGQGQSWIFPTWLVRTARASRPAPAPPPPFGWSPSPFRGGIWPPGSGQAACKAFAFGIMPPSPSAWRGAGRSGRPLAEQFGVGAFLGDRAALDRDDAVALADGGETRSMRIVVSRQWQDVNRHRHALRAKNFLQIG